MSVDFEPRLLRASLMNDAKASPPRPPALTSTLDVLGGRGLTRSQAWLLDRGGQGAAQLELSQTPLSPLEALVRRNLGEHPRQAVVRKISLKEAVPAPAFQADGWDSDPPTPNGRRRSASNPPASRPNTADGVRGVARPLASWLATPSALSIRELSSEEVLKKSKDAAEFFRQAEHINRQARTSEQMDLIIADARRQRAERAAEEEAIRNGTWRPKEPEPPKPPPQPEESPQEAQVAAPPPKRQPNLMEQFGYGVKAKAESRPEPIKVSTEKRPSGGMILLRPKKNDLKERLARRNTVQ